MKQHLKNIILFHLTLLVLASCRKDKYLVQTESVTLEVIDSIKIMSSSYLEFIDYSLYRHELLLYSWGDKSLMLYNLKSNTKQLLNLFDTDEIEYNTQLAAASYSNQDSSIIFSAPKGYYKYSLDKKETTILFEQYKNEVLTPYKRMIPFGDENTYILRDEICPSPEKIYDYFSLETLKEAKFFNLVNFKDNQSSCIIGYDHRSIQMTIEDKFRFFPDGATHASAYSNGQMVFLSDADSKLFIYNSEDLDNPRLVNYKLSNKYRPPIEKTSFNSFSQQLLPIRNGRIESLTSSAEGDIFICYKHGRPSVNQVYMENIQNIERSCITINGVDSDENQTYQSREFKLPQGVAGFLTQLTENTFLLANDAVNNRQEGQSLFYIATIKNE